MHNEAAQRARSERTQVDSDYVLRRLHDEAEADLADLYDENNSLRPVEEWPDIWRQGLVAGVDTTITQREADGEIVTTRVDKVKLMQETRQWSA